MPLQRPVLAAALLAASGLLAAQAPAPLSQPESLAGLTVALDAGHGGDDAGVRVGDRSEAPLTLAIARRVAAGLTAQGARVVLTREVDIALDADARAVRANQAHAHVYLSLHLNRSPRAAAAGAEVYTHLPQAGNGAAPADALVRWDRVQDRHAPASEHLAGLVAAALAARVPASPAPLQRVPLRLLAGLDMPAVLVELAYLSNPEQAALAETPEFHAAVADAVAEALARARQPEPTR